MPAKKKTSVLSPRKPGGQPGNWNAFKHGFYSRQYQPIEIKDLDTALGDGLMDEIALLRVIIRRVFEFANDSDTQDLDTWSKSLNTLGAAATRLAGLLRTQTVITGTDGDTIAVLAKTFGDVAHELGYPDPAGH